MWRGPPARGEGGRFQCHRSSVYTPHPNSRSHTDPGEGALTIGRDRVVRSEGPSQGGTSALPPTEGVPV